MNSPVSEGIKICDTRIFPFLSLYSFTCLRQTFFIKQLFRVTTALREQHCSSLWALCTHQATLFVGPQVRLVGSPSGRFECFSQMGEKQWSRVLTWFSSHLLTSLLIGLIMENGTCISVSNCPCIYHGTAFPVGSKIEQECSNWYVKASCLFPLSVSAPQC